VCRYSLLILCCASDCSLTHDVSSFFVQNDLWRNGRLSKTKTTDSKTPIRVDLHKLKGGKINKSYKNTSELFHRSNLNLPFNRSRSDINSAAAYTNANFTSRNYKKLRAAALTCGMALTVGAAVLISSNSPVSWQNIEPPARQILISLKTKIEDFYRDAVGSQQF